VFQDIPLHPLAVHFGVVLGLAGAVAVLLAAVVPRFRRWLGWGLPLAGVAAAVALRVTESLGEVLEESGAQYDTAAVHEHAELGELAGSAGIALAVVSIVLWLATSDVARRRWTGRWPGWLTRVVQVSAVALSVGAVVAITLAGHSGASAVWGS
jgi:hypothetical protein